MSAYYNENDPRAAAWLRELIKGGHIADGEVDERSIADVGPDDLRGFRQCHFFAGIGGWSYALRIAGWPDDRPVWTGSCPCQPFSVAGRGKGNADERHLWPEFYRLIRECRPSIAFGEQVTSRAGRNWLATVRAEMEALGYAVGAADLCSAGLGAPHIRQRLYWVADAAGRDAEQPARQWTGSDEAQGGRTSGRLAGHGDAGGLAHADERSGGQRGANPRGGADRGDAQARSGSGSERVPGGLVDSIGEGLEGHGGDGNASHEPGRVGSFATGSTAEASGTGGTSADHGGWAAADWLWCRDSKWRPVEPGTFPLAAGLPRGMVRGIDQSAPINAQASQEARVMRLSGYGNAIVPVVAAAFVRAAA